MQPVRSGFHLTAYLHEKLGQKKVELIDKDVFNFPSFLCWRFLQALKSFLVLHRVLFTSEHAKTHFSFHTKREFSWLVIYLFIFCFLGSSIQYLNRNKPKSFCSFCLKLFHSESKRQRDQDADLDGKIQTYVNFDFSQSYSSICKLSVLLGHGHTIITIAY